MSEPALRMRQIPQELSGGMRQRAMIAMALSCSPEILIADEPTTALDVTIQAQILALLKELQEREHIAILLITHDLGVAAQLADRIVVMYAGRIAEQGPVETLFAAPAHPYTRGLLASAVPEYAARGQPLPAIEGAIPRLDELPQGCRFHPRCPEASARCRVDTPQLLELGPRQVACFHAQAEPAWPPLTAVVPAQTGKLKLRLIPQANPASAAPGEQAHAALIEARRLTKRYRVGTGWFGRAASVSALDDVSLEIQPGEAFGLVGESGCGKSTLGRVLLQLEAASSGQALFEGRDLAVNSRSERKRARRDMQLIFQDPYDSLDPRWRVDDVTPNRWSRSSVWTAPAAPSECASCSRKLGSRPSWASATHTSCPVVSVSA
jgi:peptide/nickel transport system ATP-binding protein